MTQNELDELLRIAEEHWLAGWWTLKDPAALSECNGVGAAWMSAWIRTLLSAVLRVFAPAVAIHDMRYYRHEGSRHRWDEEFECNCRVLARGKYGKFNLLRYLAYAVAHRLRVVLTVAGEIAWNQTQKKES